MQYNYFYSSNPPAFYEAAYPKIMEDNGVSIENLHGISDEDYYAFMNNPPGKMGVWVDGHPMLVDVPPPDYEAINTAKREELITAALATVAVINTKMNMGRALTQAEKDKMNKVLDYVDALNALDMTSPEITWPAL